MSTLKDEEIKVRKNLKSILSKFWKFTNLKIVIDPNFNSI